MRAEHTGPPCLTVEKQLFLMRHCAANLAIISWDNRFWGPDSRPEFTGRYNINKLLFISKNTTKGLPSRAMPSWFFQKMG